MECVEGVAHVSKKKKNVKCPFQMDHEQNIRFMRIIGTLHNI